jgi:hypothetical protein
MSNYLAHRNQELYQHIEGVADLARLNAKKIDMGNYGELLGLLWSLYWSRPARARGLKQLNGHTI